MSSAAGKLTTELTEEQRAVMHEMYKHLHAHPELSMQEHQTASYIAEQLDALGIENFICAGTGVVGIQRNGEGPVVGFRADTDGLPIHEDTDADYASTARGTLADGSDVPVMHGCGHDTHITAALTAAARLAEQTDAWQGTVVWIFQPGEETAAGAKAMLEDGLWEKAPRPDIILGQHVFPFAAGSIALTGGPSMTMADSLKVTLKGRQAHGSQPQESIDPIVLGSYIITRLQTLVSSELNPQQSAVITCGTFHAGLKENIIPDKAEFTLNVRTFSEKVRTQVLGGINRIINAEAMASNAPQPQIEMFNSFPKLHNDLEHTEIVRKVLKSELGDDKVVQMPPAMGSEDFGALGDSIDVPYAYWFFGGFVPRESTPPSNHSPHFLPDYEPALDTGVRAVLATLGHYLR
ncbi:putative amidohydrolase [Glutamicibacter uratoxydans]|uniref:Putative amidohydrolase n=1 Tax=Glutamicibacter uratoxydans TaxID=43667 RepID=A0A4Y4DUH7_GLUUR|nr:amidohydrolase [Glutamicibacter uratoxydans]GED07245.1 putative amidohydrolase [Glutamicibacter uratoxydans]